MKFKILDTLPIMKGHQFYWSYNKEINQYEFFDTKNYEQIFCPTEKELYNKIMNKYFPGRVRHNKFKKI